MRLCREIVGHGNLTRKREIAVTCSPACVSGYSQSLNLRCSITIARFQGVNDEGSRQKLGQHPQHRRFPPAEKYAMLNMARAGSLKMFLFDNNDAEMREAYRRAQAKFRYVWRGLVWERRRIVPALDLARVKAYFTDGEAPPKADGQPQAEQTGLEASTPMDRRFMERCRIH